MDGQGQTCAKACDEYRRKARRMRAVYAGDPVRLHQSLRELAAAQTRAIVAKPSTGKAQLFADLVADSMDGPILRYSTRRSLLRAAQIQGIGGFEANLIIAAVQHQVDRETPSASRSQPTSDSSATRAWVAFLAIQSAIIFAIWTMLSN